MGTFAINPATGLPLDMQERVNQDGSSRRAPVLVMQSGVSAVTPGGGVAGWVSGDIANLPANTQAVVVFDLGPEWDQYVICGVVINPSGPSSGLNNIYVGGSDTVLFNMSRRLKDASQGPFATIFNTIATSAGPQQAYVRPMGRFVIVVASNADASNSQGTYARISLAAYPS